MRNADACDAPLKRLLGKAAIAADRFPLSPRIKALKRVLASWRPGFLRARVRARALDSENSRPRATGRPAASAEIMRFTTFADGPSAIVSGQPSLAHYRNHFGNSPKSGASS